MERITVKYSDLVELLKTDFYDLVINEALKIGEIIYWTPSQTLNPDVVPITQKGTR